MLRLRLRMWARQTLEKALWAIVWRMPPKLALLAFYRVAGYATSGDHGNNDPERMYVLDAAGIFAEDHGVH